MGREPGINRWKVFFIMVMALIAQLPSGYALYKISEMYNDITFAHKEILASKVADKADLEFVAQLKKEANFNQDIQVLVGPYKKLYGDDNFKYRLEKHLVVIEQSQSTKETFLILFDKSFYDNLDQERRKGVLAHEIWHIFSLAAGKVKPALNEEIDADNYTAKYVLLDIIIDLCRQYEGDPFRREQRIKNLDRKRFSGFILLGVLNPS